MPLGPLLRTSDGDTGEMNTHAAVTELIAGIASARRRHDAEQLLELFTRVTGTTAALWHGSIIGFGTYHYEYPSGRQGDTPAAGFAPRKTASVIYLPDGVGAHEVDLGKLGPHTTGVGCLYIKNLEHIDTATLTNIIATSFAAVTADTFRHRARDSRQGPAAT